MMKKLILMKSEKLQKKLNTHKNGAVALRQPFGDIVLIFNFQLTIKDKKFFRALNLSFLYFGYSANKIAQRKVCFCPKIFSALILDVQYSDSLANQHFLCFSGANPLIYKDFQQKRPRVTNTLGRGKGRRF